MHNAIRFVVLIQKILIASCSLLIAVTFGIVVVLRYGFQANLFAYEEWMLVAAFILYFFGAAQGSFDNSHIKADILMELIRSESAKRNLNLFVLALEVAIGAVLSWWGYLMVVDDLSRYPELPATPVYSIPLAVPRGTIFIGFVLMTIYAVMHFVRLLLDTPGGGTDEAAGEAP